MCSASLFTQWCSSHSHPETWTCPRTLGHSYCPWSSAWPPCTCCCTPSPGCLPPGLCLSNQHTRTRGGRRSLSLSPWLAPLHSCWSSRPAPEASSPRRCSEPPPGQSPGSSPRTASSLTWSLSWSWCPAPWARWRHCPLWPLTSGTGSVI